jgi:hypothetical protein
MQKRNAFYFEQEEKKHNFAPQTRNNKDFLE